MKPWRIRRLAATSSTNDDAKAAAEAGEAEGLVVHALKQTAGRGRHGRTWESPEGNLYCSILLRPSALPKDFSQYGFATSLALGDTVRAFLPDTSVTLKWPNDVLVDGKKIAGILLEAGEGWLVIGIGLNVLRHPGDALYPSTSLSAHITSFQKIFSSPRQSAEKENLSGTQSGFPRDIGLQPSSGVAADWVPDKLSFVSLTQAEKKVFWNDVDGLDVILEILLGHLWNWHDVLQKDGFAPVRAAWLEKAQTGCMTVKLPQETVEGDFAGIDAQGCLRLRLASGAERAIATGDVFFAPGE